MVCALTCLLITSTSVSVAGKDTADPTNRIFLVGDSADWVDTGLFVRSQDFLTIRAGSEICFSGSNDDACVRAEGWPRETYADEWSDDAAACTDPFPEWNHATLIARVGEDVFPVGKTTQIEFKEGPLELSINDCSFEGDHRNDGQFSVVVVVENPVALAARRGRQAIAGAIEAMGGEKAIRRVVSLGAEAECTAPDGSRFTTEVLSLNPDRTLFRQTTEEGAAEWLAIDDKAWRLDRERGRRKPESKKMREMIRSHEFHLTLFELESRFQNHTLPLEEEGEPEEVEAEPVTDCKLIEMEDLFGAPASVCLDPESSMPLRLIYQPAGQKKELPIEIELERWREIDQVQFIEAFTLRQGEEVFTYEYGRIEPNSIGQAVFKEVSERAFAEIRKRNKGKGLEDGESLEDGGGPENDESLENPEALEAAEESEEADSDGSGSTGS
jgi:hypothetical protein